MTKQDAINRMKQSLKIKEIMTKAADERLKQWKEELDTTNVAFA